MLTTTLLVGLAGFYLTRLARALPTIAEAVEQDVRPWSCDVCMAFWSTVPITALLLLGDAIGLGQASLLAVSAPGMALVLLTAGDAMRPGVPPELG